MNRAELTHSIRKWIISTADCLWFKWKPRKRVSPSQDASALKVALVCIARNEDNYIQEWIDYHIKLGVDRIFIYQNDWRCQNLVNERVELIPFDGDNKQMPAYNDFIHKHARDFDFAIFIDVDEFICLVQDVNIKQFLSRYGKYKAVALNWRLFGDNGRTVVGDDGYSVLKRFTRCGKRLNEHIKTILNFSAIRNEPLPTFANPHCVDESKLHRYTVATDMKSFVHGPYHYRFDYTLAWLNHYRVKTWAEFTGNKQTKGRSDLPRNNPLQVEPVETFRLCNQNDIVCTIARDFLYPSQDT